MQLVKALGLLKDLAKLYNLEARDAALRGEFAEKRRLHAISLDIGKRAYRIWRRL